MTTENYEKQLQELFQNARREDACLAPPFPVVISHARQLTDIRAPSNYVLQATAWLIALILIAAFVVAPMPTISKSREFKQLAILYAPMVNWRAPTDALLQPPEIFAAQSMPPLGEDLTEWPYVPLADVHNPITEDRIEQKEGG